MDSDTLQTAGRLTAALIPQLELDHNGDTAAGQVAAVYWAIVRQMVDRRKQPSGMPVDLPTLKST
ncbi:MAG: hypothetical protein KAQ74_06300 [Dehalococcoidia bacterium]|nr:hypothetical protein [Dehalococcoidia bacterium]